MKEKDKMRTPSSAVAPLSTFHQMRGNTNLYHHHLPSHQQSHQQQQYSMWHAKSYESGIGKIYFYFQL